MPDNQKDFPGPKKGFTPQMMAWIDKLVAYLKEQRVVEGSNITITDAPGGGKKIDATDSSLPADPTDDGDYVLRLTIVDGERTELVWELIEEC